MEPPVLRTVLKHIGQKIKETISPKSTREVRKEETTDLKEVSSKKAESQSDLSKDDKTFEASSQEKLSASKKEEPLTYDIHKERSAPMIEKIH